jgi:hypothetical protein
MDAKSVVEIFNAISPELWVMFFKGLGIAIVLMILNNFKTNLAAYFMFRTNKNLGKNVKIRFNGRDAMITHYDWRFIYITFLDTHTEALVHITTWQKQKWEVYKNGFDKKSEDKLK